MLWPKCLFLIYSGSAWSMTYFIGVGISPLQFMVVFQFLPICKMGITLSSSVPKWPILRLPNLVFQQYWYACRILSFSFPCIKGHMFIRYLPYSMTVENRLHLPESKHCFFSPDVCFFSQKLESIGQAITDDEHMHNYKWASWLFSKLV